MRVVSLIVAGFTTPNGGTPFPGITDLIHAKLEVCQPAA
jgi:hypothetical protein